jgi:hypothetical protein
MAEKPPTPEEVSMSPGLDFTVDGDEPWVTYRTKDGAVLKAKTVVVGIRRLPRRNPDGTSQYVIQTNTMCRVTENPLKLNK